ncbi:TolC family protein [Alicycliphilus denitrificans]|uniref:TolC family protein n=1 Tax=Alicycliphilus denitrificans TaxID=179636 RepID=UPI003A811168
MKASIAVLAAAPARLRWAAVASLGAALAGCATFHTQPIDPQAEAAAFEARTLGPGPWSLAALQAEAAQRSPEWAIAQARRQTAEAAAITAGARPNPALSTSAQKNTSAEPGTKAWTYGLGLDIPIETAGKRDIRVARAAWLAQAAAYAEAEALRRIHGRVREAYIGAYPSDALARERSAVQASLSEETQKRLAAGMVSSGEALQARLATRQAALAVEEAQRRRADSLRKLAAAVSVPERAILGVQLPFTDLSGSALPRSAAIDAAAQTALQTRPDVLASLAEYEAAQATLQLEIAKQYPDLSIGPGYTWDAGALKWSLALGLVLPLFDRNQGPIAEAEAKRGEAAASFRAVQEQAIADIAAARAAYAQALRLLELTSAMADDQRTRLQSSERAFEAGASDRLALLAARLEASTAESARIEALLEAHRAAGQLETALRQPLPSASPASISKGQP